MGTIGKERGTERRAGSRLSVSGDNRKAARDGATSGVSNACAFFKTDEIAAITWKSQ